MAKGSTKMTPRRKWTAILMVVLCLAGFLTWKEWSLNNAQRNFAELLEQQAGNYNEDRVVLSSTTRGEAERMAEEFGGTLRITKDGRFAVINLPEGMTLSDIAENDDYRKYHDRILLDYNNFSTADEDTVDDTEIRSGYLVEDPMYAQQTYIDYLNIGGAWDLTRGADGDGEKVTVAIIDTGIDTDHPEFYDANGNSIISTNSYDATNDKTVDQYNISVIEDTDGHGTAVAGVIAAQMNDVGITGIAPDVELLVIKCETDEAGEFKSSADIVFAIYYAIEMDVDVINMSLGGDGGIDMFNALQLAVDSDIICVASAGNEGNDLPHYPAAYDTVIGVGALVEGGWEIADYSNYGVNSDIMAPGTALTTAIGGGYTYQNGTSISAPMVTAAVALYRSQNKYVTYDALKAELLAAGKDLGNPGEDNLYGFGALDINAFICEEKGIITYDYCTEEIESTTQVFVRRHTIQTVPEPERENIVFDDWYYDKAYTRVFDYDAWYTTEFVEDVTLYAKWVNEDDEGASVYNYRTLSDGTIEIVKYKGKRRYLTIPNEIDGKIVSSIGASAFANNNRLREVTFPEGLVYIKESAFSGVSKMRAITFTGNQLLEIRDKAFYGCTSLRSVELPDSVTQIGEKTFESCGSLVSVNITENSSLTAMGDFAFSGTAISSFYIPKNVAADGFNGSVLAGCTGMRAISVHSGNTAFTVSSSTLYNAGKTEIVYYPAALTGSYTVADGVESIGEYAFSNSSISGIKLNCVTTIGANAFESTKKLTSVVLPDTVTTLEYRAFWSSAIKQVTLSENLTCISSGAFSYSKLGSVHIPANVQTIGAGAFGQCSYLKTLTFAENSPLRDIESDAFRECAILGNFVLPDSLETIGERAFYNCRSITALTIPANVSSIGNEAFRYCSLLQQVDFVDGCTLQEIPVSCFEYCTRLHTVNFSEGIVKLGRAAFSNDRLLRNLNFDENSSLTTVGDNCFYSCSALQTMQLPESVSTIGQFAYAFSGLNQAEISANVSSIGNGAFGACYLLTEITVDESNTAYTAVDNVLFNKDISIVYCVPASRAGSYTLPETVKITAPYSFYYDQFLTAVILPQGLEDIQMNSFYSCSSLAGIEIPANVMNIGRKAFENCREMESVIFESGSRLERLGIYTFVNCGFSEITIPASVEEIAQYVFYNCNDLRKITFEENSALTYIASYLLKGTRVESVVFEEGSALTSLQAHAFDGARYLKSVDFGDAELTNVDNYAFYDCAMLEEITIPDSVTYIGRYAFFGCEKLDRIDLPEAMDYIGESAFVGTNSIQVFFSADTLPANAQFGWDNGISGYFLGAVDYVVTDEWEFAVRRDGTIALSAYKGSATELTIDTVDGYTVSRIGARCFYDNDALTSITLSENITEIGNYAFFGCDSLSAITVTASVEKIGKYAFADSVVNVTLADNSGLKIIDDYAFSENVTASLDLPDTVTEIGDGAFRNSSLTALTISETSTLETIGQQAFVGCTITDIYLPGTLKTVGAEAFKDVTSLTDVEIAAGDVALKLSNGAFEGCGIHEITIPARVWYIGEYTLGSCQNLQNIHVDSGNTAYTSLDGVLCDINGTTLIQYPCGRSGAYEVPAQITVLTYSSFRDAKNLTEVTFAEGSAVRTIGWQTFSGCANLTKITVPDTVVSFDFYAFENCTALTDVVLGEGTQLTGVYEGAFYNCTALANITLPDSIVEISDYAFYNCTALTEFPLSENSQVKGIYDYAFCGCSGITEIPAFPQLAEIGEYAFAETGVTEYTVPASVKLIAGTAFSGSEEFVAIYCEEGSEDYVSIGNALYEKGADSADDLDALVLWPYGNIWVLGQGKSELTAADTAVISQLPEIQFEIADTVTSIGERAFYNRNNLVHLTIPEGVVSIGKYAFYECTGLTVLEIPESITDIGENAFAKCRAIIISPADTLPENMADNWTNTAVLVLQPKEHGITSDGFTYCITQDSTAMIGAYTGTNKIVRVPDTVKNYPVVELVGTFYKNEAVTSVTIPDKLTEMPGMLFYECKNLKSVQTGGNITAIGDYAFYNCSSLSAPIIPDSVLTIGYMAFYGCNFDKITIPENVTSIGSYAFYATNYGFPGFAEINFNAAAMEDASYRNNIFGSMWGKDSCARVTIGANVTRIPAFLFWPADNNDSLVGEIVFAPGSVCQSIGKNAFRENKGAHTLQEVILPEGLKTIEKRAFYNCAELDYVSIPGSVESIGEYALAACGKLITAGPIGGGYNFEFGWADKIPAYAFSENDCLKKVVLPDTITAIGEYAFYNCSLMDEITMSEKIAQIGKYAFYNCRLMDEITMSEEIAEIGEYAFCNCASLKEVMLSGNMTEVGNYAFLSCPVLTIIINGENLPATCGSQWSGDATIILNPKTTRITEDGQKYYIMQDDTLVLGRYLGENTSVVIPEQIEGMPVTEITSAVFAGNRNITHVSIPDTVTSIGAGAFRNCTGLKEITIPENVVSMGNNAFSGCAGLEKINFNAIAMADLMNRNYVFYNAGTQTNGIMLTIGSNVTRVPAYMFQQTKLISVAAEDDSVCTSIGAYAFHSCSALKEVSLPESVTKIEKNAFLSCVNLEKISIPAKSMTIESQAFQSCTKLETAGPIGGGYDYEFGWVDAVPDYAFYGCSGIHTVSLPDSITSLGYGAFYGCALEEIPWPESLTKISGQAFANNAGLTEAVIPDSVTSLGSQAFYNCTNLTRVVIPAGAKPAGGSVFSNCTNLKTAGPIGGGYDIEFGWTGEIPANALSGTRTLKQVVLPDGITSIGGAAFSDCSSLSEITLPDGVASIGYEAFRSCTSLGVIVLPSSVTSIGREAFSSCSSLIIIFKASVLPSDLGNDWCDEATYILNPLEYGKTEDEEFFYYITQKRQAGICSYFGTSETVEIPDQISGYPVTILGAGVFKGKTSLTGITLPDTITQIDSNCFYGCTNLSEIVLPDSLTTIGMHAFFRCTALTELELPDSLTYIGLYAFRNCTSLTKIEVPKGVVELDGAFDGCTGLTEVILSEGLKVLGTYTFDGCTSLADITLPESLEEIGYRTFGSCSSLHNILIPKNVTELGDNAFYGCTALKLVQINSPTVAAMITSATSGGYLCNYADTVAVSEEITEIGSYITDNFTYMEALACNGTPCVAYSNHEHTWSEGEVVTEYVECQQDGVVTSACADCGLTGNITISAHDYAQTETVEPTCTEEGSITFTCTRCAHSVTETLDKAGHSFGAWYTVEAASGTSPGVSQRDCEVCGHFENGDFTTKATGTCGKNLSWVFTGAGKLWIYGTGSMDSWSSYYYTPWEDYYTSVKSVQVDEGITNIGKYAFGFMEKLTSVSLPESLVTIGDYAFYYCTGLTSVTIPDSVTSIGSGAFDQCRGLTSITIPDGVTSIGYGAFGGCRGLTSINIPDGVTSINDAVFRGCSALTSITIPDGVTSIGASAFQECTGLTSINIPDGVTSIGGNAFCYCTSLTSVTIPDSVTSIGNKAFAQCNSLTGIWVDENNQDYISDENGVLFDKVMYQLIQAPGKLTGDYTMPEGVVLVNDYAFINCTELSGITMPESVAVIGESAFNNCSGLTDLTLPEGMSSIGDSAFRGCTGLVSVRIPNGISSISNQMFWGCSSLTTVEIPVSVTSVGEAAFSGCTSLSTVTLPESVTSIGEEAFNNCKNLTQIVIPDSVISIGHSAFYGCRSLTSVELPEGINSIGSSMFSGCSSLTSVNIPSTVTQINSYAFQNCSSLTSVTIPANVTVLGSQVFHNCTSLTGIWVDEANTVFSSDEKGALYNKEKTTLMLVPNGMTDEYVILDTATSIKNGAFNGCAKLKSVTIPENVVSIGNNAFYQCKALEQINFNAVAMNDLGSSNAVFYQAGADGAGITVHVGPNVTRIPAYLFTPYNSKYYYPKVIKVVFEENSVCTSIGNHAFSFCITLQSVVLPDSVTQLEPYAFYECTGLSELVLSESLTCIDKMVFYNCDALTSVTIPNNVTSIGANAFDGCSDLTSVTIPDSVTSIGSYAFYYCGDLNTVIFKGDAPAISSNTFYGVRATVYYPVDNTTWTADVMQNYGGTLTWRSMCAEHEWGDWAVATAATCTQDGEERRDCVNCDHFETRTLAALGHSYEPVVTAPTCTDQGYTTHTCTNCGDSYMDAYVDALGHTAGETVVENYVEVTCETAGGYDNVVYCVLCEAELSRAKVKVYATGHNYWNSVTSPTCTEEGYTTHTCTKCGKSYVDTYVDALGHSMGNWTTVKAATCTEEGTESRNCSRCDYTETRTVAATGHSYESVVTEPTCEDKGYTTHTCTVCGDSYVDSYTDALGHKPGATVVENKVEATCETDGHYDNVVYCSVCNEELSRETVKISATGHSFGAWKTTKEPTCTETGEKQRSCSSCGKVEKEVLPVKGHSYESVVTAPTCTEQGYTTHTCTVCGDSYVDSYTDALGHNPGAAVVENKVEATCETDGHYDNVVYCSVCNEELSRETVKISATGHSFGAWQTAKEPTCTETGEKQRSCSSCGKVEKEVLPANGHSYESVVTAPSCTEQGYTTHTCTVCGDSYVDSYTDALGHKAGATVVENKVEATCETDGHYDNVVYCSVCNEELSRETVKISATGHSFGAWQTTKEPTCTETGEKQRSCSACGKVEKEVLPANGHSYSSVVTEPTCTEDGYTTHICTVCGDSYVDSYVDALGHAMGNWTTVKAATCTEDGTESRSCSNCDHTETRTIAATGHSYSSVVTAPTCTEDGYTTHTCTACGDSYVDSHVDALGHAMGNWTTVKTATCTEDGTESRRCSRCDYTETRTIAATGHNYESVVTDPTCTEDGYTTHTCTTCGDSYVDPYVAALGHAMGNWTTVKAATCTEDGTESSSCSRCDHTETRAVAATGHSYESVVTAPTCTDEGYTTHTCTACGDSYVDSYVDALGHAMSDWATVKTATCTEEGTESRNCSRCDHTETRTVAAIGHSYESVVTAPTCTEQGYTTHTCTACGDSYVDSYMDALGHAMSDWTTVKAATCTEEGTESRNCSRCDHTETRAIAATGHSYESVVTAPTCTEQGYTTHTCTVCGDSYVDSYTDALGHKPGAAVVENNVEATCETDGHYDNVVYCSVCNEELSRETVTISATGHSFGAWQTTKEPTCTETGEKQRSCSSCGKVETEVLPAKGHSYESVVTAPTCTDEGYTTHTCTVCGDSYVDSYTDALGHKAGATVVENKVEATCEADGHYDNVVYCSVCNEELSRETVKISATGHSFGAWQTTKEPTCTETGEKQRSCASCGKAEKEVLPANGHNYESVVTAPTCTEQGYTTHTCTACGDSYVDSYVDALGHAMGNWTTVKAATCTEDGTESRDCSRCDHTETRAIAATGHSYESVVTAPTCTEQGYTTHTCANCGDSYVDSYVDALDHNWDAGTVTVEPTEDSCGEKLFVCQRCGETKVESIPELEHKHSYTAIVTAPTCQEQGYTTYTCTKCGDSYVSDYTAPVDHSYEDGECIWCGEAEGEEYTVKWATVNTTLTGSIDLNYYAVLSDNLVNDPSTFVRFTCAGKTVDVPMSEASISVKNGVTRYRFSCKVFAKQMTDTVTAQVMTAKGPVGEAKSYSVAQYCNALMGATTNEKTIALCKAMLNYGAAAQTLFSYNLDNMANATLSEEDRVVPEFDSSIYAYSIVGEEAGIKATGAKLMLDEDVAIRVTFKLTGDKTIEDYTFTIDGEEVEPVASGDRYYIELDGIAASKLNEVHTFSVGGLTVNYSALSYAYMVHNASSSDALIGLVNAMYAYHTATAAYVN